MRGKCLSEGLLHDKATETARFIGEKVFPVMIKECQKHGVPFPRVEWYSEVWVAGKEETGLYDVKTQTIVLNRSAFLKDIKDALEKGRDIKWVIYKWTLLLFHELKHHIDHKAFHVSLKEYKENRMKYEVDAEDYSMKMADKALGESFTE
jgi:hypothetical protein